MRLMLLQTLLIFIIIFTASVPKAIAQENPEEMVKRYNIQFPIAELGNCGNFSACKAFCDLESNRETCMSFAKKKGFYNEVKRPDDKMMQSAKSELGCDSESSCRLICEQEANREKCSSFAQKHGLGDGPPKGVNSGIIQKAKEILGCDSEASCRSVCENPSNQEKCSNFAQQTGLGGGIRRVGPGGCNSEESCNAYCQSYPDECRSFGSSAPAGEIEKFCRENPEKCANGRNGPPSGSDDFCRQNPDKCRPPEEANRGFEQRQEYEDSRSFENREQQVSPQTFQQTSETQTAPPVESREVRGAQTSSFFGEIREWLRMRGLLD